MRLRLPTDPDEAITILAARKLAERERTRGSVGNPAQYLKAVRDGIRIDNYGRIASMPDGLTVADQVRWIEGGPPAPGARIPPPEHPIEVPDLMPPESWRAGITEARKALEQAH